MILVIGGSGSGKSEFAENLAMAFGEKRLYIATMKPFDNECRARILRHQIMRQNKGFETKEIYESLYRAEIEKAYDVVLLECMSNLLANEMFSNSLNCKDVISSIINGVQHLSRIAKKTIIVSNEIFSDGDNYSKETLEYIRALGEIHAEVAKKADEVIEIVCGIPIYHKGANGQ